MGIVGMWALWGIIFVLCNKIKSKLQVLSFMFISNFKRCPLPLKLTGSVLNV
ncbi:hypothetical protein Hanom_Chr03g00262291 [Helianthus anomalus]